MSDEFTETTSQGWGSRLMESIKGVLLGLACFIAAFPLLSWNEGRAIITARSLEEGAAAVISVPADTVDSANEGQLVHTTAEATTDETLTDPVFDVSENAIQLARRVEMYQWDESKETETHKTGGGTETTVTYRYQASWSDRLIDSSNFQEQAGHSNPGAMDFEARTEYADHVALGAFSLSPGLIRDMDGSEKIPVLEVAAAHVDRAQAHDGGIYFGNDPLKPEIGDTRVTFEVVRPAMVSIVAAQVGNSFSPYATKAGRSIELLSYGSVAAAQMFAAEMQKNALVTWAVRFGGFLLMAIGLGMVFRPLVVVADVLPFFGDLLGMGLGLFCAVVAGALSLITIAVAWIAVRPLLGVPLLMGGIALLIVPKVMGRKRATLTTPGG